MQIYKHGSRGDDVKKIQSALVSAGFSNGAVDGIFGQETELAVKKFQTSAGLSSDGIVGAATWNKLFLREEPVLTGGVASRCLALTGSFETGLLAPDCFARVAGNFDGQGMSFGALQWNFGQGTLQPLFAKMITEHRDIISNIFGADLNVLETAIKEGKQAALAFANTIQDSSKKNVLPAWRDKFKQLGLTAEFQEIETMGAAVYFNKAINLCTEYELWSNRGRALMFDICVQNGSISSTVKTLILNDFKQLSSSLSREELEVAKMRSIANRRAEAANPKFVEDVRKRKLCIADGKGVVHGINYDLAAMFGLEVTA